MKQQEDSIITKVRERFKEKYPSILNGEFNKYIKCFVGWVVEETLKEVNK